jgi:hypothetical protein
VVRIDPEVTEEPPIRGATRIGAKECGALALACVAGLSCGPRTTDLHVDLIVPEDATDLDATNNVTMVLEPGDTNQFEADGLDFSLELELDPDDTLRTLTTYLALDTELLAWGRTAEFTLQRKDTVGLFLGRPGKLSTFPLVLDLDDPALQSAYVYGRGVVLLDTSGATTFIDEISLVPASAATLSNPPTGTDGTFVGDSIGGASRVRWNDAIAMQRFDVGGDEWIDVDLESAADIGARPGAASWSDASGSALYLFGGGEATSIVEIDLVPTSAGSPDARIVADVELDTPRRGASATVLLREESDDGEVTILCGGEDDVALVRLVEPEESLGPVGPWTAARCVQVDRGPADAAALRMLCGGGVRAGTPTGDAVELVFGPAASGGSVGTVTVLEHPDLIGLAMPDVRWFVDAVAVYAQGEGALQPFAVADWAPGEVLPALRARGGSTVELPTGATLVAGGEDQDGIPTSRMQVFTAALPESTAVDRN